MDEMKYAVIRDACNHLLMRYATAVDAEDIDKLVTLFAEEFTWHRPATEPMREHAEIREFFRRLYAKRKLENPNGFLTRHNFTTVCIEPLDEENATGIAYALVYTDPVFAGTLPVAMAMPELQVEYRDHFKKTAHGWKIIRHEARHIFRSEWAFVGLKPNDGHPISE